ncbi:MAG: hypothetical protein ACREBZ_02260 [Thermoplasmata archaeon]
MSAVAESTARRPPRRRAPWSIRSIVVDVTGRPISEFQEEAPKHDRAGASGPHASSLEPIDPVDRITPPLSGAGARHYHGVVDEQHPATLRRHPAAARDDPSPSNRPERIYLHYLLLHIDRLSLASLWYLRRQVNEEISHRSRGPNAASAQSAAPRDP